MDIAKYFTKSSDPVELTIKKSADKRTSSDAKVGDDSPARKGRTVSLARMKGWGNPRVEYSTEVIDGVEQVLAIVINKKTTRTSE